ncbi:histidine protein methyltransferase 1-like protein [Cucumis melo var. makuwa]|uniref:Histidine protein methyltransferase 1-like protein n=1 Tax=Cucumis melo var. makuwa TaxID=1194695 RepID=A0A5D3CZP3_CUCMM|nr:histidine protein methyltransferase 1-like protein [Cucumis melo var. makuwa]
MEVSSLRWCSLAVVAKYFLTDWISSVYGPLSYHGRNHFMDELETLVCLPGLLPQDKGSHSSPSISERDVHLPSPAVEILPSKTAHPYKYAGENVDLQGLNVFKGRVSVADIIGFNGSESTSSKPEGHLKSWDSSIDLVNVLKHEIRDGQLSFRGKRVLELGCSYGLPGVFACLKGASIVHFQDLSAETVRCTTIPNVLANLEQARDRQSRQPESPLTPSRHTLAPSVHFYAGDWEELPTVLSVVRGDGFEAPTGMSLSFSEEDFMDGCSSQDGSIIGHESSSRRSRKLSGSRAWERASEADQGEGGYDIILMAEIPFSLNSLKKLYALIKKCVRPPYGVLYLATKKNYVGFNSGARHLRSLVDEEGVFGAHLVKEMTDRDVWKFFLK